MKKLTTTEGVFGPFESITVLSDRYRADGAELPFTVVGDNGTIEDWLDPIPEPEIIMYVPKEVTMRQARLALLQSNNLLAAIQPAIDALSSPDKEKAQIEWDYSSTVQRHNSFVSVLAGSLGLTESQIDGLFILAATL